MNNRSAEFKTLERDIGAIDDVLGSIKATSRLDEQTFKTIFLPMFLGVDKSKLHPHAQLGAWINCAGGVYNEVEIFGSDGETLFNVPPAKLQLPIDYNRDRRTFSLTSELQTARLHAAHHPKRGEVYLKSVLDTYVVNTKELEIVIDYMKRWNAIFKRYGHAELQIPGVNSSSDNNRTEARLYEDEVEELL